MNMQISTAASLLKSSLCLIGAAYLAFGLSMLVLYFSGMPMRYISAAAILCFALLALNLYLHFRIRFDAGLLEQLIANVKNQSLEEQTEDMDQQLLMLKLMPESKAGRNWPTRINGCLKLLKLHAIMLGLQYLAFFCIFFLFR